MATAKWTVVGPDQSGGTGSHADSLASTAGSEGPHADGGSLKMTSNTPVQPLVWLTRRVPCLLHMPKALEFSSSCRSSLRSPRTRSAGMSMPSSRQLGQKWFCCHQSGGGRVSAQSRSWVRVALTHEVISAWREIQVAPREVGAQLLPPAL